MESRERVVQAMGRAYSTGRDMAVGIARVRYECMNDEDHWTAFVRGVAAYRTTQFGKMAEYLTDRMESYANG